MITIRLLDSIHQNEYGQVISSRNLQRRKMNWCFVVEGAIDQLQKQMESSKLIQEDEY